MKQPEEGISIDRLRGKYLDETGTVEMEKRKDEKTSLFGLTWRGFFASLASSNVCTNILLVLDKLDYLQFPIPREVISVMVRELWGTEGFGKAVRSLFEGFVTVIPNDIESSDISEFVGYLIPAAMKADPVLFGEIKQEDFNVLSKYPKVMNWLEGVVDNQVEKLETSLDSAMWLKEQFRKMRIKSSPRVKRRSDH